MYYQHQYEVNTVFYGRKYFLTLENNEHEFQNTKVPFQLFLDC